jgi:hypothetical protein
LRVRLQIAGTGGEMQAARLIGAFGAHAAGLTQVALVDQPDAGDHDILAGGNTRDNRTQHIRQGAILRNRDHGSRKIDTVHSEALRHSEAPGNESW